MAPGPEKPEGVPPAKSSSGGLRGWLRELGRVLRSGEYKPDDRLASAKTAGELLTEVAVLYAAAGEFASKVWEGLDLAKSGPVWDAVRGAVCACVLAYFILAHERVGDRIVYAYAKWSRRCAMALFLALVVMSCVSLGKFVYHLTQPKPTIGEAVARESLPPGAWKEKAQGDEAADEKTYELAVTVPKGVSEKFNDLKLTLLPDKGFALTRVKLAREHSAPPGEAPSRRDLDPADGTVELLFQDFHEARGWTVTVTVKKRDPASPVPKHAPLNAPLILSK